MLSSPIATRARSRFEREARALAALNHPNIATLHGMEEADGRHFLVMELVDGETLAERIGAAPVRTRLMTPLPSPARSPRRSKPRTKRASSIAT